MPELREQAMLTEEDLKVAEQVVLAMQGDSEAEPPAMLDLLASPQAVQLVPRIVVGQARLAAEAQYVGTRFLRRIRMPQVGAAVIFPTFGVIRAYDLAEGQPYKLEVLDTERMTGQQIFVGPKSGVAFAVTEEMIRYSQWDVVGMHTEAAGRALARHKEQKIFREFSRHGHVVFDNALRSTNPEAGTTGRAEDGTFNDTMSVEDFLDLIIAVMANEFTPTDLLMHPLTWITFAKQGLTGGLLSVNPLAPKLEEPTGQFRLGPESVQGRLPFAFTVNMSPWIPIDKEKRTYEMYCVDRNNVGVLIVAEDIRMDEFNDPMRDIRAVKLRERYGIGILYEGRGIAVARNIKLDVSYPKPIIVRNIGN